MEAGVGASTTSIGSSGANTSGSGPDATVAVIVAGISAAFSFSTTVTDSRVPDSTFPTAFVSVVFAVGVVVVPFSTWLLFFDLLSIVVVVVDCCSSLLSPSVGK